MKFATTESKYFLRKSKSVYPMLEIVLLLINSLLVHPICVKASGIGHISFASNRSGNFDIYLTDTSGENLRVLTNHPADERYPTWSPDGQFLAYASNRDGNFEIYVMDIRKKKHHQLTHHLRDDLFPAWSPDGKWIAFSSKRAGNADIYKMDINGAHLARLTDQGKNGRPAWSPDSQWIAFVSYHRGNDRKGIYVMDADGKKLRRLNDQRVQAFDGIFQGECAWSPDGKRIAFGIDVPRHDRMHLCVIDVDGKNFRQLTQGGPILRPILGLKNIFPNPAIYYPAWSPDGKWIAYVFSDSPFPLLASDIYVIDAEGNGRGKPLVKGARQDLSSTWAPERFLSVSPSAEKQTTLWGRLKQKMD